MKRWIVKLAMATLGTMVRAETPPPPVDFSDLGGIHSAYSDSVVQLVQKELKAEAKSGASPIDLRCWTTPGRDLYIGLEQRMHIQAPLKTVAGILDDFSLYKDLFPGFSEIHLLSREGKKSFSYWEQPIPLPFVPNVKYEMIYLTEDVGEEGRLYRYQLRKSNTLTASDGFIWIAADKNGGTRFVEYDFFDAKWGAAKVFGPRKLWLDAIEGMAQSDVAIKLKAENADWPLKKAREQSRKAIAAKILADCYESRKPFELESAKQK